MKLIVRLSTSLAIIGLLTLAVIANAAQLPDFRDIVK